MTTPRKNFNYNSPYATPVQQYPSQSEDYISLDMGGPMQQNNIPPSSSEKTPGHHNLNYYQQNYRNSSSKANRRNLFNNSYAPQNNRQSFNQKQRYGPRRSNERQQPQNIRNSGEKSNNSNDKRDVNSIASYCHPSMTEDPWFELMQRVRALEKSKISPNETSTPKSNSPSLDICSSPSSDIEQDHVPSD